MLKLKKFRECSKLKPYKVQEIMFSSYRSSIAYNHPDKLCHILKNVETPEMKNEKIKNKIYNTLCQTSDNDIKIYPNGFMMWKNNTIYMTFRGIVSSMDWLTATNMKEIAWDINNHPSALVHGGFLSYFTDINDTIQTDIETLLREHPIERIIFSGHSMGGALAILASTFYSSLFKNLVITCHTFGAPAIGNDDFIHLFEDNVDEFLRIEYVNDIVPKIPLNDTYLHISNGIVLNEDGYYTCCINRRPMLTYEDMCECVCFPQNIYKEHNILKYHNHLEKYIDRLAMEEHGKITSY